MTLVEQPQRAARIAAVGDLHCREAQREEIAAAFAAIERDVDVILLAGDLTTHGEPEQALILADACRPLDTPVLAVLGNHDWHVNRAAEVVEALEDAGIVVLERNHAILEVADIELGVVGLKGFVGGFDGHRIPDFGEPLLRTVYAEMSADVEALDAGLRAIAASPLRIVLLHYAPVAATLEGEPREIWAFLGSERLATPIAEHLATWPLTIAVDRVHPARDEMPRLSASGRAFAQATWRHLVFGIVMGELERRLNAPADPDLPPYEHIITSNGHGKIEHVATAPGGDG